MARNHDAWLAEMARRARMPFDWRRNDCARYAAACVKAQTGRNALHGLRWASKAGAARVLLRLGGMEAAVDARLTRIAPAMAMRGDVAGVFDPDFGVSLMIVEGATLVGPGETGEKRLPRAAMIMAWSAEA